MTARVHVIGAGLAGLAAALAAAQAGAQVVVHEAAPQAGGRCRSFHDRHLDRLIDAGTHLLVGANHQTLAYLRAIGATMAPLPPHYRFAHVNQGWQRTIRPLPPPAGWSETALALGLPWVGAGQNVAARLGGCPAYEWLWRPLCLSILNTSPEQASARMLARVLRALMLGGPKAFRGYGFAHGLSAALIDPALARLQHLGAQVHFGQRLSAICQSRLTFGPTSIALAAKDRVILALPPWVTAPLLGRNDPFDTNAIANMHYRVARPLDPLGPIGLVGGIGHWLSVRGDVVSVTVSAAEQRPDPHRLWAEIAPLLAQDAATPPYRLIWEKRATLVQSPDILARRPGPRTMFDGVFLAGDWIASPWPCTMESAISSGLAAARLALGRDDIGFS